MRTFSEGANGKCVFSAFDDCVMRMIRAFSLQTDMKNTTEKMRYNGNRKATNIVLNEELVTLAQKFFPTTKHRSLSGFVGAALKAEFRKAAVKIRGAGLVIPEAVFTK